MLELESSTSAIACSFLLSEKERGYFKKINRIIFFNQRHSKTVPYCCKSFKENGGWKCQSRANYLPGRKEISFTFTVVSSPWIVSSSSEETIQGKLKLE